MLQSNGTAITRIKQHIEPKTITPHKFYKSSSLFLKPKYYSSPKIVHWRNRAHLNSDTRSFLHNSFFFSFFSSPSLSLSLSLACRLQTIGSDSEDVLLSKQSVLPLHASHPGDHPCRVRLWIWNFFSWISQTQEYLPLRGARFSIWGKEVPQAFALLNLISIGIR